MYGNNGWLNDEQIEYIKIKISSSSNWTVLYTDCFFSSFFSFILFYFTFCFCYIYIYICIWIYICNVCTRICTCIYILSLILCQWNNWFNQFYSVAIFILFLFSQCLCVCVYILLFECMSVMSRCWTGQMKNTHAITQQSFIGIVLSQSHQMHGQMSQTQLVVYSFHRTNTNAPHNLNECIEWFCMYFAQ